MTNLTVKEFVQQIQKLYGYEVKEQTLRQMIRDQKVVAYRNRISNKNTLIPDSELKKFELKKLQ